MKALNICYLNFKEVRLCTNVTGVVNGQRSYGPCLVSMAKMSSSAMAVHPSPHV